MLNDRVPSKTLILIFTMMEVDYNPDRSKN